MNKYNREFSDEVQLSSLNFVVHARNRNSSTKKLEHEVKYLHHYSV